MKQYWKNLLCWWFGHQSEICYVDCGKPVFVCFRCEKDWDDYYASIEDRYNYETETGSGSRHERFIYRNYWRLYRLIFGERRCCICGKRESLCQCEFDDVPF